MKKDGDDFFRGYLMRRRDDAEGEQETVQELRIQDNRFQRSESPLRLCEYHEEGSSGSDWLLLALRRGSEEEEGAKFWRLRDLRRMTISVASSAKCILAFSLRRMRLSMATGVGIMPRIRRRFRTSGRRGRVIRFYKERIPPPLKRSPSL